MMMKRTLLCLLLSVFFASNMLAQKRHTADRTAVVKAETPAVPKKKKEGTAAPKKKSSARSTTASAKRQRNTASPRQVRQYISITPKQATFSADGGTREFYVSASGAWYISNGTFAWGHLTRDGNRLTLRVDANTSSSSRTDYFQLSLGNETARVDFTQEGAKAGLTVSASALNFSADKGAIAITVSSSADWRISVGTATWGHLSRSGNTLTVSVDENNTGKQRTDYFKLFAGGTEKTITITQTAVRSGNRIPLYGTTRSYAGNPAGLSHLTNCIKEWNGKCRLGALTDRGIGAVIYGQNGYAYTAGVNNDFSNKLKELNANGSKITSLCMTHSGYHCIVFGRNGWYGYVPSSMSDKLYKYNRDGEEIYCVSVSESGRYVVITDKHMDASDTSLINVLKAAGKMYGHIKYACVTNLGIVIVCQNGIYYNNIPTRVATALRSLDFWPDKVVFTDSGTYLITNENDRNTYYM